MQELHSEKVIATRNRSILNQFIYATNEILLKFITQLGNHTIRQQRIKKKKVVEIHDYHVLRRSSPLQLNLNCTIFWIDKMIPLIDSFVANHICEGYIYISQSILPSKIKNICYLKVGSTSICFRFFYKSNWCYVITAW